MSPEDRLADLEAEARLLKGRIRERADTGEVLEVEALYRRIPQLRLELEAARYVVARVTRKQQRHFGHNSALDTAEHHLAVELATLNVPIPDELRGVLG